MSHDETSGYVSRKARREAFGGKRQAAPRYVFKAADYVRQDWSPEDVAALLERRARGYNGILRDRLCTAAAMLRDAVSEDLLSEKADETVAPVVSKRTTSDPSPSGKRNQQPGRLSGSEREALKKFVDMALYEAPSSKSRHEKVMAAGRALLAKVRKRALDTQAQEIEDLHDEMQVQDEQTAGDVLDAEFGFGYGEQG